MDTPSLTLRRLAILIAAAYSPCLLASPAARIEFATAEPVIVGADGRQRPALKGEQIVPGDRILTRAGRAQLAFADGAFVSLQPNTDFGVTEYNFKGSNDGTEKSVLSLLKGALRTVTGMIGRSKRDAYLMTTPTATIGIRGTGGRIQVNENGTFVAGTSGTWFLSTPGGSIDIPPGTTGFAGPNGQNPPTTISGGPSTPPPGTGGNPPGTLVIGNEITPEGTPVVLPLAPSGGTMADGSGYQVAYAQAGSPTFAGSMATFLNGTQLSTFQDSTFTQSVGGALVKESGNDGIIGWGRWTEGTVNLNGSPISLGANDGLHYVVGMPTASMPTTGSAIYNVIGKTSPTDISGVLPPGTLVNLGMSVDFSSAMISMNVAINMSGQAYAVNGSFSASPTFSYTGLTGSSGACNGSGCTGSVFGSFYGSNAERAGVAYKITDNNTFKSFVGAAALTKNPPPP